MQNTAPVRAVAQGDLSVGETQIRCFVVEFSDGQEPVRLLSGRAITQALGLTGRGAGMARLLNNQRLRAMMSESLVNALESPVSFHMGNTGLVPAMGYDARMLPELCFAIIDANEARTLPSNMQKLVTQSRILSRAFATVGIIALVDEATGYQYERQSDALQRILSKFISEELVRWVKTFPDEFYRELFRLRGLTAQEFVTRRPPYFGHLTNDIVYERLAPGVLEELRRVAMRDGKGRPKHKYFQRLSEEVGHPRLREHLAAVVALMKAADNYPQFILMLDRAKKRYSPQPALIDKNGNELV